jgi:hypothetical protein
VDDGGATNAFVVAVTARVRAIVQESFICGVCVCIVSVLVRDDSCSWWQWWNELFVGIVSCECCCCGADSTG